MRPARAALLLVLGTLVAGCATPTADTASPAGGAVGTDLPLDADGLVAKRFAGIEHVSVEIPSPAGYTMHADYFLPADATEGDRFPVVMTNTPYMALETGPDAGGRRFGYLGQFVDDYVERGYVAAYVDTRAFGGTGGCWDYYGDDEMADVVASVEWFASQPWSNGKVGMFGVSYPGTTQLLAAIGGAEGLAAIVPVAPEPSVYENQYKNGVPYRNGVHTSSSIYSTVYPAIDLVPPYLAVEGYPGYAHSAATTPLCLAESFPGLNDPDNTRNAYYRERDRQGDAGNVTAAVLWSHGFWDQNVKPDVFVPFLGDLAGPRRAWLWQGYHDVPGKDETGGRDDFDRETHLWFDRFLLDVPNGVDAMPAYEIQDSLGRWRYEDAWPPADAAPLVLHLADGGALSATPGSGRATFRSDARTNFQDGWFPEGGYVAFQSEPAAAPLHVAGVPTFTLALAVDLPRAYVVTGLFDVAPDGTWTLWNRGALDLRHRNGFDAAEDVVPGERIEVAFDAWPMDWVVEPGHAIGLVVAGIDMRFVGEGLAASYDLDLAASTMTLPVIPERTTFFATTESSVMKDKVAVAAPGACGTPPACAARAAGAR